MYLLGTLVLGMLIPFLPIDMLLYSLYQEPAAAVYIEPLVVSIQQVDTTIAIVENTAQESTISWWWVIGLIYGIGVLVGFSRFGHGLYKIFQLYRSGTVHQKGQYNLVLTNQNHLPFSFFNHLFWSSDTVIQDTDAEKIFTHEIGHINQWHSLDILFLEILSIVCWFSPPIYWYKKSLRAVHEFLADACVLKDTKTKVYGQLLLQQAQSGLQMSLANHFLNSQLKKRIKMMTRNKSSQPALMKYLSALPLVILLVMLFGNPQMRSNFEKEGHSLPTTEGNSYININQDSTSNPSLANLLQGAQAEDLPIYVNGILTSKESTSISVNDIASINVLKGLKAKIKYGDTVTKGVVEIQLVEGASLFLKDMNRPAPEKTFTPDFKIKAFHNPVKQEITLYFDGEAIPTTLKISKQYGRTIYEEQVSSFDGFYNKTISLGHVTKGTLLIQFKQGGKTVEEKVIVK